MAPQTDKEIQQYKIRTVIFLIIILLLTSLAIYQFYTVQSAKSQLEQKVAELEDANNIIALKDSLIEQKAIIEQQKLELDTAITLLGILVNEQTDTLLEPAYILANLQKLATDKRQQIARRERTRKALIEELFSRSERSRKEAQRKLIRNFSDDRKLVKQLLKATEGRVSLRNQNAIYQIIYILEQLSYQSLHREEEGLRAFFDEVIEQGMAGAETRRRLNAILARLEG